MKYFWAVLFIIMIHSASSYADTHHPQDFLKSIKGNKDEGKLIYTHFCINCHDPKPQIALGAPRKGIKSDWELRIKQGAELLFKHTDEGMNAMPPRGGCFECSDKQLILAIIFMLPKSMQAPVFNELSDYIKNKV